jgi:pimeloyl-ACP methyl ester carboxylesterase
VSERLKLDPGAKAEFYAYYRRLTPIGYANALRALLAMDHVTDRLREIRVPVLLIGGDRDPSLEPMKVMHRKVRGAKLVVLSPATHFANRDQPEAWNRAALDFLSAVERRSLSGAPRPPSRRTRSSGPRSR